MEVRGNQALPTHNKYCPQCNHCTKISQTTDTCWDIHGKPPDKKWFPNKSTKAMQQPVIWKVATSSQVAPSRPPSCPRSTPVGLLNGGSKRRKTPIIEVSYPLPPDAVWKKVSLRSGLGKREREYTQGWSVTDEPLCKRCQKQCMGKNAKRPEFLEDLFCNLVCYEEYRLRTSNRFLREELFKIEHGVCTNCQLDCHKLVKDTRPLSLERRREFIQKIAPNIAKRKNMFEKLVNEPTEGNAWHADHIVPVYQGGGECKLENMRTLCVACHSDVTAAQCSERSKARANAKKKLKELMGSIKIGMKCSAVTNIKDHRAIDERGSSVIEDELFLEVPGSAYSIADS
ncbi:uncharacterized protein LOC124843917 [Vigna umbellata]|uniref:uncharacterized protein LOC124843917 n=1 Tax=Vigna umbellata TaxID=87088 RepID=UPI001F5EE64A|nr:uncharacterized protein LOC124843917 [Vigna umbellata]